MKSFGLSFLFLLCLVVGCGAPGGMIGKWTAQSNTPKGPSAITIELNGDNSFDMTFEGPMTSKASGTFSINGKEITFNATNLNGQVVGESDREPIKGVISEDGKSFTANNATFTKQ